MGSGTDSTYGNQLNYREQGGNRDVVGGEVDVVSAGHIDVESGGYIAIATGGDQTIPVTAASTASSITNFGHTTVASTGTRKTFTLAAPVAGVTKSLVCTQANSTGEVVIDLGSGKTAAGKRYLQFDAANEAIILRGRSTTVWDIISNVGSVQSTTSTT